MAFLCSTSKQPFLKFIEEHTMGVKTERTRNLYLYSAQPSLTRTPGNKRGWLAVEFLPGCKFEGYGEGS